MQSAFDSPYSAAGAGLLNHINKQQEQSQVAPNGNAGPSSQRVNSPTSTTAEAIANFKPSPRDVISGIAPHVFDERRRRRFQKKRATKPYWYGPNGEKRSSPLRGATVVTWDETSIYLEQPDTQRSATVENHESDNSSSSRELEKTDQRASRRVNRNKSGWKHFRVDTQLLKSLAVKLKLATSQNSSKP